MIEQDNTENLKKLIAEFKTLTAKVKKDNQTKLEIIKDTNLALEACKKEYKRLHAEHENFLIFLKFFNLSV